MKKAYIGIGSNLGDTHGNCRKAIERMGRIPGCSVTGLSELYLTEPVGVEGQDWYVNGVIAISTSLSPQELIKGLYIIEADMGRVRKERWGPRTIDLDILLFGQDIIREPNLTIPHPRMHERRFVIAPMVELAPDLVHPTLGKKMTELLAMIPGDGQVVKPIEDQ